MSSSKNGSNTITKKENSIHTNADGKTTITSNEVSKSVKNEIQLDSDTKVKVSEVDAGQDDAMYLELIKKKDQLAILKDTNHYICMLSVKHMENIFKKMGSNLKDEINLIAFGIYSMEEINEIKKSFILDVPKVVFENVTKNFEVKLPELNKMNQNKNYLNNKIFENVQDKIDFIKAEEERKRKEEEERKRKIEEEKKRQMEMKEKNREKAKMKLKKIREDNIKEILMKKFKQYRNNIQGLKIVETKKTTETEKKVLRLKIKKDPKNKADEEAKKKKEEEEKKRKEEEERKKKLEEEARKKKEEEERKKKLEEEAKKKKEEEERKKKLEEEARKKKLEEERKKKEEEERKKKLEEEARKKKLEEERKKKEEEERKKKLEEEARKKKEEEERKKKLEEEARKKKEEEERKKKLEEEARKKKEEEERKKKLEEEARKKKEDEERKKKEEEEARKKKEEEEERKRLEEEEARKKKEEEERLRREEEERKKREGEERLRQEEEARKKKEEEERLSLEEEARKKKEEEEERKRLEEEARKKREEEERLLKEKEKEEEEKRKLESERSKNQEPPTTNIESLTIEPKEDNTSQRLRSINSKKDNIEEKESEQNEEIIKPKKKKVIKKVKKIIKVPRKKAETIDNRKPFYVSGSTSISAGGIGKYYENVTYTGHIPKPYFPSMSQCKCDKCHKYYNNTNQIKNSNDKTVLFICENCARKLNNENNGIKNLKSYEYYHNFDNGKYDQMNEKEFYEKNRNRYTTEFWRRDKKGIKSKSIEKVNKNKIDEDSEFDNYINGLTTERYGSKDINNLNRKIKRCRNNSSEVNRHNLRYINGNPENDNLINGMNKIDNDNLDNNDEGIQIINNINDNNNGNKINKNDNINIKEMECPQCKNSYALTRDIRFYHCSDCKKIMCGKCSKKHYMEYPDHNCSNTDINGIVTNLSYEFNNDLNNNKYDNFNTLKNKENKKERLNVKKFLNKIPNQEKVNNINNNEIINPNLNDKDYLNQNNINANYLNNYNEYDINKEEENGANFNYNDCFLCGIKQRDNPQDRFYKCRECDRLLCQSCRKKHDLINPQHNLVISYISGEILNL